MIQSSQITKYKIIDADAAIVCLPTPTVDGVCDDLVRQTVTELLNCNPNMKILLKSTLTPEQLETYPQNVTYNPEFLRAATAREDYANQKVYDYWWF